MICPGESCCDIQPLHSQTRGGRRLWGAEIQKGILVMTRLRDCAPDIHDYFTRPLTNGGLVTL
jgi:hypothetical protein